MSDAIISITAHDGVAVLAVHNPPVNTIDAKVRAALGAQLCLDCQAGEEAQASRFKTWGRR